MTDNCDGQLRTDDPTVLLGDHDRAIPGRQRGVVVGEPGQHRIAVTRVLDVDEHRPLIRCDRDAGDLTTGDAREEPPDLVALRVGDQHLVVGVFRLSAVGLDEKPTERIRPHAIGRTEIVAGTDRVVGEDEDVPLEAGADVAVIVGPANDVTVEVRGLRVGRIGHGPPTVVGQRAVHGSVGGDRGPLRAVHRRRAGEVGRDPGVDQKRVHRVESGRDRGVVHAQLEPPTGAVFVEPGRVERAFVERRLAFGQHRLVVLARHELVDVVESLIVTHVGHGTTTAPDGERASLVLGPPERRALDRRSVGIPGVVFDDPAESIGLVDVVGTGQIEARVELVPGVAESGVGQSVAGLLRGRRPSARVAEVAVEVLLTGQVGAPWGVPIGTVVQRARRCVAGWVLEQRRVGRRPRERNRRVDRDPAVGRVVDDPPLTPGAPGDLDHAVAVSGLHDPNVFGRLGRRLAEHVWRGAELVVDAEPAGIVAARLGEEPHAVVPDSDLRLLFGGRRRPGERWSGAEDGRAPRDQDRVVVVG